MTHMNWFGQKVFDAVEYIGEGVVSVLGKEKPCDTLIAKFPLILLHSKGLDESRYQDVLDGMTEEEMARAQQVHEEREAENRLYQLTLEQQQQQNVHEDIELQHRADVELIPVVPEATDVKVVESPVISEALPGTAVNPHLTEDTSTTKAPAVTQDANTEIISSADVNPEIV